MSRAKDFPFLEVCQKADAAIKSGWTVHQKFTCAGCGARQTIEKPNVFYTSGECEECQHVTDLREAGCNYMMHNLPDEVVRVVQKEGE